MKAFPAFPVVRVMSLRSLRTCLIARDRDVRRVDLCEIELVSLDSRLRLRCILTFLTPRSSEGRTLLEREFVIPLSRGKMIVLLNFGIIRVVK